MIRIDRGYLRLGAWVAATIGLMLTAYAGQLFTLASGLDTLLTSTLGTDFPAYPFLVLLFVLTALRWKDFHEVLVAERGVTSMPSVRLAGLLLVSLPAIAWAIYSRGGSTGYFSMELAAASLVLLAYGSLLAINPTMWRIMLPYAALYAIGLLAPLIMLDVFGASLATLSSALASAMTGLLGIPVAWNGVAFAFVSATGEHISAVVTPACSAAYSISIYLSLLGLMYLDMRRSVGTTAKFAVVGVLALPLVNSARISLTIWFGFQNGAAAFWGIHDWLGYATFLVFYVVVLAAYSRSGSTKGHVPLNSQSALNLGTP